MNLYGFGPNAPENDYDVLGKMPGLIKRAAEAAVEKGIEHVRDAARDAVVDTILGEGASDIIPFDPLDGVLKVFTPGVLGDSYHQPYYKLLKEVRKGACFICLINEKFHRIWRVQWPAETGTSGPIVPRAGSCY